MDNEKSILQVVADMADFANAVASMVVGHRKILVEGGFDINLADQMAASLHGQMLGLAPIYDDEPDHEVFVVAYPNDDEDEDDE